MLTRGCLCRVCYVLAMILALACVYSWEGTHCMDILSLVFFVGKMLQVLLLAMQPDENVVHATGCMGYISLAIVMMLAIKFGDQGSHMDTQWISLSSNESHFSTATGLCHVRNEAGFATVLDHSKKFAAGFQLTTGFSMGLRNIHSNVLICGRPFWLHAFLFNSVVLVVMAIAVKFANPKPWGILQWAHYSAGQLASYGWFLCSACCSTWMVRSYWYPQFTTGVADRGADSKCQLGTGTGTGAHPQHACDSVKDLGYLWGEPLCTESESPGENVSQTSAVTATSFVTSTEPLQSKSTSNGEEDDANLRPRKLPRVQTADHSNDGNTSQPDFQVNSSKAKCAAAVLDLECNIVMSNAQFIQLCSKIGHGNEHTGLLHLKDVISFAVAELLWRKACWQQLHLDFNKASEHVHIQGTVLYLVESDRILWSIHACQHTPLSNGAKGGLPDNRLKVKSALTVVVEDEVTSTLVSREIPAAAVSVQALVKSDVVDISEAWIDGLAAGPSLPSWDQFVLEQQRAVQQQKEAPVVAEQKVVSDKRKFAAVAEVAGLRDLLWDALKHDPCDHDQQVDILLYELAKREN